MTVTVNWLPQIKELGLTDFSLTEARMREYTKCRTAATPDAIWLTHHAPTYTLGQAGKDEHLLRDNGIPVVRTNRGGQITYHGPGQVVAYVMHDLARSGLSIRNLVQALEQAMLAVIASNGIKARRHPGRPGVYVGTDKIGAVGLRVSRSCSYHGCSLNVDCDLAPFADMNTCGYADLGDTSIRQLGGTASPAQVARELGAALATALSTTC